MSDFQEENIFIGTVEDVFQLTGIGLVLCLNIKTEKFDFLAGTKIKILKPNKEVLKTKIRGRVWQSPQDISIGEKIKKEEVPIGSEVWLDE